MPDLFTDYDYDADLFEELWFGEDLPQELPRVPAPPPDSELVALGERYAALRSQIDALEAEKDAIGAHLRTRLAPGVALPLAGGTLTVRAQRRRTVRVPEFARRFPELLPEVARVDVGALAALHKEGRLTRADLEALTEVQVRAALFVQPRRRD